MLLHLSDLHFGTEKVACLTAIQKFCAEQPVELIAVSGDLTQRARVLQFWHCKQFLDSLKLPYIVVPGNHDIPLFNVWNRLTRPFGIYHSFFGNSDTVMQSAHFYVVGLNSIRRRHHTRGSISEAQIRATQQQLAAAPAHKIKLVMLHQPFYSAPDDPHGNKDCPTSARLALKYWSSAGLMGVLHGHLHQIGVFNLNKIYALKTAKPIYDIHAGTACSSRLHLGTSNSFNTISPQGAINHYVFDSTTQQFVWQSCGLTASEVTR